MTDALRSDRHSNPEHPDRDRDARIEELLLTGLDHYFAGRHDLAINIWTRVLFLDRSHAKARAYIERARGALAEKQREAEELLQIGADALTRGDRAAARELLTSAERAGGSEEALALLHRLDRLDASVPAIMQNREELPAGSGRDEPAGVGGREARLAWIFTGIATGILLAAIVGGYFWLAEDPFELTVARSAPVPEPPLPVPATCEIRLARARSLMQDGKLHDAQSLLEAGDPDALHGAAFDELRATIQRQLLEAGRRGAGFSPTGAAAPREKTPAPARGGAK
jgi:tetratricopeptide (TPR) repeat protein